MHPLVRPTRTAAVAALAAGAVLAFAGPASAEPDRTPVSGDDRATVQPGNVVGHDCDTLFPGSTEVGHGDLTFTGGDGDAAVDITAVPDGVDVVGVVVKGGPAYNIYAPDKLGDMPWTGLHAPLVPSGGPAAISHWFACAVESGGATTAPSTPTSAPTTAPAEGPAASSPAAPEEVSPAADDEELAETGVDAGWPIAIGALLLLGGGALLVTARSRSARR